MCDMNKKVVLRKVAKDVQGFAAMNKLLTFIQSILRIFSTQQQQQKKTTFITCFLLVICINSVSLITCLLQEDNLYIR